MFWIKTGRYEWEYDKSGRLTGWYRLADGCFPNGRWPERNSQTHETRYGAQ